MPDFKILEDETGTFARVERPEMGAGCHVIIRRVAREDSRLSVDVAFHGLIWLKGKIRRYTTVRNIDGSNRFMDDDGSWSFLPHDYERAVAALSHA